MRASGTVGQTVELEAADHICWVDDDARTFIEAAVRFLGAGLARGERLLWVGNEAAERLRDSGGRLSAVEELTSRGALELISVDEAYGGGNGSLVPREQLHFYEAATRRALADGYSGLRAVAEVTTLASDEATRETFLDWEQLCDRLVASGNGLSVLCAYRRDDVPPDVLAAAAARHPVVRPVDEDTPFRVWFDADRVVLSGELDTFGADRFHRLMSAQTGGPGGRATLDLSGLSFIDLAGVRAVTAWVRRTREDGAEVTLLGAPRLFRRMWEILGMDELPGVSCSEDSA